MHLLGSIQVLAADGRPLLTGSIQPKRLALLAYLAVQARLGPQRRDVLVAMFWPELDEAHARGALSQSLYYLREQLGRDLFTGSGNETVGVRPDALWSDATAFEEAIAAGDHKAALALYRGELLPGLLLSDAPGFERWVAERRRALCEAAATAAWELTEQAIVTGDAPEIDRWGRRTLELVPDAEGRLRRIVSALDSAGDRARALRIHEEVVARMAEDLDLEPAPETVALAEQVRAREEPVVLPAGDEGRSGAAPTAPGDAPRARSVPPDGHGGSRLTRTSLLVGVALLLLGAGVMVPWLGGRVTGAGGLLAGPPARLAIVPARVDPSDSAAAMLVAGFTEALQGTAARYPGVRVLASGSVQAVDRDGVSPPELARALGASALLMTSATGHGDSVIVTGQLLGAGGRMRLWERTYRVPFEGLPAVQQELARAAALALVDGIAEAPVAGTGPPPAAPGAYAAYLRGRYFLGKLDGPSFVRARDAFIEALDADPTFAPAWAGLAAAYAQLASVGALPSAQAYPLAREAAHRALALDPELAEAHAALATALSLHFWDNEAAERHFRLALELDPSSARAHRGLAAHLRLFGRFDEALAHVDSARMLDPLLAFSGLERGVILYLAGRYEEAIRAVEAFLDEAPERRHARMFVAMASEQLGRHDAALAALDAMDPAWQNPDAVAYRGYVYARMGRGDDVARVLGALDALEEHRRVTPFMRAAIDVGRGELDRALDRLEEGTEHFTWHMRLLAVEPTFEPLHRDPRFAVVLRRVGLRP